jgi:hypothetical protein
LNIFQTYIYVTAAAKFMSHSDPEITLKIYTPVLDSEIDEIGVRLKEALRAYSNDPLN